MPVSPASAVQRMSDVAPQGAVPSADHRQCLTPAHEPARLAAERSRGRGDSAGEAAFHTHRLPAVHARLAGKDARRDRRADRERRDQGDAECQCRLLRASSDAGHGCVVLANVHPFCAPLD